MSGIKNDHDVVKKPKAVLGVRHIQVVLLFMALVLAFSMRVNMSLAIVAMTDGSEDSFNWSMQTQSVILSSFSWGYIILQIPGGELAARYGGMIFVILCVSINSAASLLLPISAFYGGWPLVCACRVVQGLSQGFIIPSMHNLMTKWVPLEEKSSLGAIISGGAQLGTALQLMASGFIADSWGWPAIFYVNGVLGALWTVACLFLGSSSPEGCKFISAEEKFYIESSLGQVGKPKKRLATPWKAIWTSLPFISLIVVHCGQNWGFWTLMTEMPSYMKQVLGVDIKANAVMSALPYLAMYILSFPFGFISDLIIKNDWLTLTTTRKLSNSIGHYGPAIALIGLSYSPAGNVTLAVLFLTIVVGLNAGQYTGFTLVHLDMAPNFAGTLIGITNCFANIVSILAPIVAGAIIGDETDPSEWRKVFYVASAVYLVCNTFYVIFGTSLTQAWNEAPEVGNSTDASSQTKMEKVV